MSSSLAQQQQSNDFTIEMEDCVPNASNVDTCESAMSYNKQLEEPPPPMKKLKFCRRSFNIYKDGRDLEDRAFSAGVSQDLLSKYKMFNRYHELLEKSSIETVSATLVSRSQARIVIDRNKTRGERMSVVSTVAGYQDSESQRNEFIWNELVKLNNSEVPTLSDSDPVSYELARMYGMLPEEEMEKREPIYSAKNNILHFFCTQHNIDDLDTFIKHKRPDESNPPSRPPSRPISRSQSVVN